MKCVYCQHFTFKGNEKHAALGLGRCKADWSMAIFMPWGAEPDCSKRQPARDMAKREEWVKQREGE